MIFPLESSILKTLCLKKEFTVRIGSQEKLTKELAASLKNRLGALLRPISSQEAEKYGLSIQDSVAIKWVDLKGPLWEVGFEKGDIFLEMGGLQHALHKAIVRIIERENGIYLGQILAGTSFKEFFDEAHQNSRLKQYQMEKFLQAVDDGWILRRARYTVEPFRLKMSLHGGGSS